MIDSEKPDLILLDVRMGGIDGLETLKRLRDSGNQTEVIMVTGVNEEESMNTARSLGVVDYVHKPLVLDELEKVVLSRLKK